jgi:phenylacetic acid degradation operon negative regulatory protein
MALNSHQLDSHKLSAPDLILSLLDSAPQPHITAASLIAAGDLFGIDSRAIRVAATRLVKQDVLTTVARGIYGVGGRGHRLHRRVVSWVEVESRIKPWNGDWLAVYQAHLKRANKTAVRARSRALRLQGFAAVDSGLAVRPANLTLPLADIRQALIELGLQPAARLWLIQQTEPAANFEHLWDTGALEARYANHVANLQLSTRHIPKLDTFAAAKQTLALGREVTRDIVMDPLLPQQMINTELRGEMITAMKAYDTLGKDCWRAFYAALKA